LRGVGAYRRFRMGVKMLYGCKPSAARRRVNHDRAARLAETHNPYGLLGRSTRRTGFFSSFGSGLVGAGAAVVVVVLVVVVLGAIRVGEVRVRRAARIAVGSGVSSTAATSGSSSTFVSSSTFGAGSTSTASTT